jgi:hypothetical protein
LSLVADAWGQSQRNPKLRREWSQTQSQSKEAQQAPTSDQRGTEKIPLAVKVIPTKESEEKAANDAKDREEKMELDRKLVHFNGDLAYYTKVLAWVAALQFLALITQGIVFAFTLSATKKAANAAKESAEAARSSVRAFIDSERGRMFISEIKLIKKDANDPQPAIDYTFVNAGRGTVVLIQGSIECNLVGTELPSIVTFDATKVFGANNPITPDSIIGSNTDRVFLPRCSVDPPLSATEIAKIANKQAYILFKGFIRYRTGFNDIYRRNFASVYGTHGEYFSEVTIPGYNEEYREPNPK